MKRIAVLMTCHNRKEKTLVALKDLHSQRNFEFGYSLSVYLVDDGSNDGTSSAVKAKYPNVNVLKGNGNLYWNRGMYTAWQFASSGNYDFYLWLNDDTNLFPDAVAELLSAAITTDSNAIICGSIESPSIKGEMTYGGGNKLGSRGKYIPNYPTGIISRCDIINGNCVLVPHSVFVNVGNLDWTFVHAMGDNDYSLRAKKKGIYSYSTGNFVATCEKHDTLPKWQQKQIPLKKRLKNMYSPLGYSPPYEFFIFESRHFGFLTAVKHFFSMHIRVFFPNLWV